MFSRAIAVAAFGSGLWATLAGYTLAAGRPMSAPEWEFALETYTFGALAAAGGFATAGCRSVFRALCSVPVALILMLIIPRSLGIWLSESYHSVALNIVVLGLLFAIPGAAAGWLVAYFFKFGAGHA